MDDNLNLISWILLVIAIVLEVSGTISMKMSDGFTKIGPVIAMLTFYAFGLSLLAVSLKTIEVSVAYAVWSGLGIVLITIIGILWFKEAANMVKIFSISLIIIGVVGLNWGGGH